MVQNIRTYGLCGSTFLVPEHIVRSTKHLLDVATEAMFCALECMFCNKDLVIVIISPASWIMKRHLFRCLKCSKHWYCIPGSSIRKRCVWYIFNRRKICNFPHDLACLGQHNVYLFSVDVAFLCLESKSFLFNPLLIQFCLCY